MTADGTGPSLVVDVAGLPERSRTPLTRWQRTVPWCYLVLGSLYLGLGQLWGYSSVVLPAVAGSWLLLGASGLLGNHRAHLRLERGGVRRVGALGRGRLTPWSAVAEVRPPEAWHEVSHLRGHGRFPETTDLPGLSGEDARELQRRLEAARASLDRPGGHPG